MTNDIRQRIEQINRGEVPLGYKKTLGGIVPDTWIDVPLKNLLHFKNGINAEKEKFGTGIKLISVVDILDSNPITYDSIRGAIDIDVNTLENYSVTCGDVLFQRSSENFEDAGKSNVYLDKKTATYSGFVIRGKKVAEYEPLYLNGLLKTHSIRKQIIRLSAGSQHINIGQESLAKIMLCMPEIIEQQKIAEILSKWDKAVSLQEKLIEKLELQKKALMQQLLTPKKDWKKVKFREIYKMAGEGGTPSTYKSEYYENGNIPFVKIEHLNNKYIKSIDSYITEVGLQNSGAWLIPINSLLFSNGATIGETAINKIPVTTKQGILGIVPQKSISVEFLYYYINAKHIRVKINSITTKGTMPIVYLKDLDKLTLEIPSLEEQEKVASFISLYDKELLLISKKLEKLKQQKKSMQQLLLTGIVRVN